MKKRLRKKLHREEFQQYGISIMIPTTVETVETILNGITDIADRYNILFCGGGLGWFVLPSEEFSELEMPSKVEFLMMNIALSSETLSDCIVGYFINPKGKEIAIDAANKMKEELQSTLTLKVDFKINCRISLWN
jgi:hypothetical protein